MSQFISPHCSHFIPETLFDILVLKRLGLFEKLRQFQPKVNLRFGSTIYFLKNSNSRSKFD